MCRFFRIRRIYRCYITHRVDVEKHTAGPGGINCQIRRISVGNGILLPVDTLQGDSALIDIGCRPLCNLFSIGTDSRQGDTRVRGDNDTLIVGCANIFKSTKHIIGVSLRLAGFRVQGIKGYRVTLDRILDPAPRPPGNGQIVIILECPQIDLQNVIIVAVRIERADNAEVTSCLIPSGAGIFRIEIISGGYIRTDSNMIVIAIRRGKIEAINFTAPDAKLIRHKLLLAVDINLYSQIIAAAGRIFVLQQAKARVDLRVAQVGPHAILARAINWAVTTACTQAGIPAAATDGGQINCEIAVGQLIQHVRRAHCDSTLEQRRIWSKPILAGMHGIGQILRRIDPLGPLLLPVDTDCHLTCKCGSVGIGLGPGERAKSSLPIRDGNIVLRFLRGDVDHGRIAGITAKICQPIALSALDNRDTRTLDKHIVPIRLDRNLGICRRKALYRSFGHLFPVDYHLESDLLG